MRSGLPPLLPLNAALIVIDLQRAIDHPSWGIRNNFSGRSQRRSLARPLARHRAAGLSYPPRFQRSRVPLSSRPARTRIQAAGRPLPGEAVLGKHTANAFVSTDLEERLRRNGQTQLLFAGVITNNSVEATVRMAGDLGFETILIEDGVFTFGRNDWMGVHRTAEEVHAMSLANLDQEYCRIVSTRDVLIAAGCVL